MKFFNLISYLIQSNKIKCKFNNNKTICIDRNEKIYKNNSFFRNCDNLKIKSVDLSSFKSNTFKICRSLVNKNEITLALGYKELIQVIRLLDHLGVKKEDHFKTLTTAFINSIKNDRDMFDTLKEKLTKDDLEKLFACFISQKNELNNEEGLLKIQVEFDNVNIGTLEVKNSKSVFYLYDLNDEKLSINKLGIGEIIFLNLYFRYHEISEIVLKSTSSKPKKYEFLKYLTYITKLTLSNQSILYIPECLKDLNNVKHLELSFDRISKINLYVLNKMQRLDSLSLMSTKYYKFNPNILSDLYNLKCLKTKNLLIEYENLRYLENFRKMNVLHIETLFNHDILQPKYTIHLKELTDLKITNYCRADNHYSMARRFYLDYEFKRFLRIYGIKKCAEFNPKLVTKIIECYKHDPKEQDVSCLCRAFEEYLDFFNFITYYAKIPFKNDFKSSAIMLANILEGYKRDKNYKKLKLSINSLFIEELHPEKLENLVKIIDENLKDRKKSPSEPSRYNVTNMEYKASCPTNENSSTKKIVVKNNFSQENRCDMECKVYELDILNIKGGKPIKILYGKFDRISYFFIEDNLDCGRYNYDSN